MKWGWGRGQLSPNQPPQRYGTDKLSRSRTTKKGVSRTPLPAICALRWALAGAAIMVLTGCGAKLPDCKTGLKQSSGEGKAAIKKTAPQIGAQVFVGIDGSGSMLGFAQASDKNDWPRILQSISQGILVKGLEPITYRIGAGVAEGPLKGSVTQATNPCFFKGCKGFRPVASGLETLWTIQVEGKVLPLRLLSVTWRSIKVISRRC